MAKIQNRIDLKKKKWERTKTFKAFEEKRSKGITVNYPFEFSWQGPGYREKYLIVKIKQPINNQIWEDLWVCVKDLQEDAFGKIPKGRPREKSYHRDSNQKIGNTLQACIKRGKEIYGSHVDSSWRINFPNASIKDISEKLSEMSERGKKFICYSFSKMGKSNRTIGRLLGVNKDTIRNWINEVDIWPEAERKAVEHEVRTSKGLPDTDVYDTGESEDFEGEKRISAYRPKTLQSVDGIADVLTNEGVYKSGRKKQHKASDKRED